MARTATQILRVVTVFEFSPIPVTTDFDRCHENKNIYNQSAHRGVIRVYSSMGDRRGKVSPEERGEEEERRKS